MFWRFSITSIYPASHSLTTNHWPLVPRHSPVAHASPPTLHAPRSSGPPSLPRAEMGPAFTTRQAVNMLRNATFSGFLQKFGEPCFRRKLILIMILCLFPSWLACNAIVAITIFCERSCAVMIYVAYSPKSRHFEPFSGHFAPIRPTNQRRERSGLSTSWHAGNVGRLHRSLATVLPPPASRSTTPGQRGRVVRSSSPAGYCQTPTAELPKTRRGPISTIGPSLFSMSQNLAILSGRSNFSSAHAAAQPGGGMSTHFLAPRPHGLFRLPEEARAGASYSSEGYDFRRTPATTQVNWP